MASVLIGAVAAMVSTLLPTFSLAVAFGEPIRGTERGDSIKGTQNFDLIIGRDGNDILIGKAGNDLMIGGGGNDALHGDLGNDALIGGPGSDSFYCGPGKDIIIDFEPDIDNKTRDCESVGADDGILVIQKEVIDEGTPTKSGYLFNLILDGSNFIWTSENGDAPRGSATFTQDRPLIAVVNPGSYTINEREDRGFTTSSSPNCKGTVSSGQIIPCKFTNSMLSTGIKFQIHNGFEKMHNSFANNVKYALNVFGETNFKTQIASQTLNENQSVTYFFKPSFVPQTYHAIVEKLFLPHTNDDVTFSASCSEEDEGPHFAYASISIPPGQILDCIIEFK